MKKQKPKKQTAVKRCVAKPKHTKPKAKAKPVAVVSPPPVTVPKAKSKAKPVAAVSPPPVTVPKAKSKAKPVMAVSLPPLPSPVAQSDTLSESETLRRIEQTLTEMENAPAGTAIAVRTGKSVPAWLTNEVSELIEELIVTASPKLASTVSRLAYVLCDIIPGLKVVSERADITLCRKNGVTFGWNRKTEEERAFHSGQRLKSIPVS